MPPNMEQPSPQELDCALASLDEGRGNKSHQFKGIRLRKWGSWIAEIRMTRSREKLWLGSYATAEQAARAYDTAVYCLRGPKAKLNFPNSVPNILSASSLSCHQIQRAAAKYALDQIPSSPPSLQGIKNSNNKSREEAASPSRSASVSETELSCDSHHILEEHQELDFWESLFERSKGNDGWRSLNLERMPLFGEASALDFICGTWQEQQEEGHMNILVDPTELWNF